MRVGECAKFVVASDEALVREEVAGVLMLEGICKGGSVEEEGEAIEGEAGIIDVFGLCKVCESKREVRGRSEVGLVECVGARRKVESKVCESGEPDAPQRVKEFFSEVSGVFTGGGSLEGLAGLLP